MKYQRSSTPWFVQEQRLGSSFAARAIPIATTSFEGSLPQVMWGTTPPVHGRWTDRILLAS